MKKIIPLIAIIFSCVVGKAQITLDTVVNKYLGYEFKPVQISATETKWFFADTLNNTFSLLNMDFTPFAVNIAVPEPFAPSSSYMQALYITRTLFDCDSSNIEYAYYTPKNIGKPFKVLRLDGTVIFEKDSANGPFLYGNPLGGTDAVRPIVNTSAGAKLFLQPYPLLLPIYVYSLCGNLPNDVFDFNLFNDFFVSVYPNPTSDLLNFQISLPDNNNQYELTIFDATGQVLNKEKVKPQQTTYTLDTSNYSSGSYFYSLTGKDKTFKTGKFILNR